VSAQDQQSLAQGVKVIIFMQDHHPHDEGAQAAPQCNGSCGTHRRISSLHNLTAAKLAHLQIGVLPELHGGCLALPLDSVVGVCTPSAC